MQSLRNLQRKVFLSIKIQKERKEEREGERKVDVGNTQMLTLAPLQSVHPPGHPESEDRTRVLERIVLNRRGFVGPSHPEW